MRYLLLLFILFTGALANGQNNWDKKVGIKTVNIQVEVKDLLASTTYEFEFINPQNTIVEGLYTFKLLPDQVVTAMQLELDGKYRDATIEEKWKANTAYREIVGKRIDPALLVKDYNHQYRLNIYPMPANGTRKIKITIDEVLPVQDGRLVYSLPLAITDIVREGKIELLLKDKAHIKLSSEYEWNDQRQIVVDNNTLIGKNIFTMEVPGLVFIAGDTGVIGRLVRTKEHSLPGRLNKLLIMWDVSASMKSRNLHKEITYLQKFIKLHKPETVRFLVFSDKVHEEKIFDHPYSKAKNIEKYLRQLTYDGATSYKALNMFEVDVDYTLLFSDGEVSLEKNIKPYRGPIKAITTGYANVEKLKAFTCLTKDAVVNIASGDLDSMITRQSLQYAAQDLPVNYEVKTIINDIVYVIPGENITAVNQEQGGLTRYDKSYFNKLNIILTLNDLQKAPWYQQYKTLLKFGIEFRVVTPHTAFIVLERLEDYIKYDIAVPPDMYEAAAKVNYTHTQHKYIYTEQAEKLKQLNRVIEAFNKKYNKMLPAVEELPARFQNSGTGSFSQLAGNNLPVSIRGVSGSAAGLSINNELDESVVVTGYKVSGTKTVVGRTGDVFTSAQTIEQALQGRAAGVQVSGASAGFFNNATVSIRGAVRGPLWVLDNIPVDGNINDYVIGSDIDYVEVLKSPFETAVWGSRGADGVILVFTKKGKSQNYVNTRPYRLSDMEDEDYLQELKSAANKIDTYNELRKTYSEHVGFFIDVADYFYSIGLKEEARRIILNAIEAGNNQLAKATVAQVFAAWGEYGQAIEFYEQLIEPGAGIKRLLAWCYYRNGNVEKAINILYDLITEEVLGNEWLEVRAVFLQDLMGMVNVNAGKIEPVAGLDVTGAVADIRVVISTEEPIESVSVRKPGDYTFQKIDWTPHFLFRTGDFAYDFMLSEATKGTYKFRIKYNDYRYYYNYSRPDIAPKTVQVFIYRNYGKPNQTIEQQNISIDNQSGEFEIMRFNW